MDHHHPHDASSTTISTSEQQEQGEEEEANDVVDLDLDNNNNNNDDDNTIFMDFSVSPSDEFLLQEQQQQQQQQEPNHPTMWDWNPSSSSSLSLSFLQRRQYESELSLATYMTDLGGGDGGMMDNNTNNNDDNNHAFHHHPQDNTTATAAGAAATNNNNEDQSIVINNIQRMILPTTVRPIDTTTTTTTRLNNNNNTNNDDDDDDGGGGSKKPWHTSSSLLNNVPPSSLSITTAPPPLHLPPPPFTFITDPTLGILTEANWFNDYEKWNINNNDDDDMKPKKDDTTTTTVTTTTTAMFMDLPLDLIIYISSYLDFKAIQNCMVTNRTYRNVLIHAQQSIWKPLYYKKWPHLLLGTTTAAPAGEVPNNNNNNNNNNDCEFLDIFSIPITCVGNNNNNNNKEDDDDDDTKSAIVVDDDSNHFADDIISTTTTTTTMINHSLLLSLGAQNTPNCIDLSLLEPGKRAQRRHLRRLHRRFGAAGILFPPLPPLQQPHQDGGIAVVDDDDNNNNSNNTVLTNELITVTMFDGTTTGIQFIGTVGDGDRCIRSDQPLPRPLKKLITTAASASGHATATGTTTNNNNNIHNSMQVGIVMLQSLLARLQRDNEALLMDHQDAMNRILHLLSQQHNTNNNHNANGNSNNNNNNNNVWRPFVAPFLSSDGTINVTPRLISYYEITIHEKGSIRTTETGTDGNNVMNRRRAVAAAAAVNNGFRIPTDCVAVGLATSDFQLTDRMPGWDINSIGYHGDDGGLFYGAGMMSRRIGPSFGLNDTVGCGIDYSCHCIFFTLNGTFLGYEPIRSEYLLHRDLYPVIGIDTNYPITANFGLSKPFQFDLTNMIYHQKNIICQALQMNTNPAHSSSSTEKDNTETVTSAKYRLRSVSA